MRHSIGFLTLSIVSLTLTMITGCAAQNTGITQAATSTNQESKEEEVKYNQALLDPSKLTEKAPAEFTVKFETSKGDFYLEVTREWAPNAADRFYNMVKNDYFNQTYIFRAIDGFMFQFGIHGNPKVAAKWGEATFPDDPYNKKSNVPGTISFAQTGRPNSRSCQIFINLGNNSRLDQPDRGQPFVPFGKVVKGFDSVVKKIETKYGENPRNEDIQGNFKRGGNAYIKQRFDGLDYIKSVTILTDKEKAKLK